MAEDDFQEFTLAAFLQQQSTNFTSSLPLVHTTDSGNFLKILREGKISVTKCDTFTSENLAYFFHGRPSYRKFREQPMEWELPVVLIMNKTCLLNTHRIFPFDSGAFHSGRLPGYITNFGDQGYQLAEIPNALHLLIDIFFGDDDDYFYGRPKAKDLLERRRHLTIRHSRIKALASLYNREQSKADDRAMAIEIQTRDDVILEDNIIGAVLPRPYFDDKSLKAYFKSKGVIVKSYDIYPLNTEGYMAEIYKEVRHIYKKKALING